MVTAHPGGREVAKIIDFGIAKIVGGSPIGPFVQTQAGIIFGTADFLAPERLLGKGDSDPRSDLYSAGVVLYEMLAGERPFRDPDPYLVVKRAISEVPLPPSTHAPDVPSALDAIVLKALAKEPEQRYASAREMLSVLDPLAKRGSSSAHVISQPIVEAALPSSFPPVATASTPPGGLSGSPLAVYADPPPRKVPRWMLPAVAAAAVLIILVAARSGSRPTGVPAAASVATKGGPAEADSAVSELVTRAAEGDTVADRQSAFDRLVAFGYVDRVPWVPMLGKDLAQLPTCEDRKVALEKLRNVKDLAALPYIQEAAARPDNGCLADDAQKALASLRATGGAAPDPSSTRKKAAPRSSSGGGHF
jgi:hypothetical protein